MNQDHAQTEQANLLFRAGKNYYSRMRVAGIIHPFNKRSADLLALTPLRVFVKLSV